MFSVEQSWLRSWYGILFAMVRSHRESHFPKKYFIVKSSLARKNLKGSQQKSTSMQVYIVRHDILLLARYKIWLKSPYAVYLDGTLIKLFYQLQDCRQQQRQKNLNLNHYPNQGNGRCLFSTVIELLKQAQRKLDIWIHNSFRFSNCSLCVFPRVALDVLEHFSPLWNWQQW